MVEISEMEKITSFWCTEFSKNASFFWLYSLKGHVLTALSIAACS